MLASKKWTLLLKYPITESYLINNPVYSPYAFLHISLTCPLSLYHIIHPTKPFLFVTTRTSCGPRWTPILCPFTFCRMRPLISCSGEQRRHTRSAIRLYVPIAQEIPVNHIFQLRTLENMADAASPPEREPFFKKDDPSKDRYGLSKEVSVASGSILIIFSTQHHTDASHTGPSRRDRCPQVYH